MDKFIIAHKDLVDFLFKVATMIIALFNVGFAVTIFFSKSKKDDKDKEKDRKMSLLKTLVLDHNLKIFYAFFEELELKLSDLKKTLNDDEKGAINTQISDKFSLLRRQFTDVFIAIDTDLYSSLITKMDSLQDHLTSSIFDAGVNLTHEPKFNEVISNKLSEQKAAVLKMLFGYRG